MRPIGCLIDADQPLDPFGSAGDLAAERDDRNGFEPLPFFFAIAGSTSWPEMFGDQLDQHLADQARFARARNARHGGKDTQRKSDVERSRLLRVTPVSFSQPAGERGSASFGGRSSNRYRRVCDCSTLGQTGRRAAVQNLATMLAGSRSDVDQPIGVADHVQIVFDDEQRIAAGLQAVQAHRNSATVSAGCKPAEGSSST